ncbi:MAG: 30S ribosomal protein S4 [Candidatus Pacearchaeota archaeon]
MIRKKKKYSRPKKPFDKLRIEEENKIKEKYGLKNKREIWKAEYKINKIREKAKKILTASYEEQKKFIEKLNKIGLNVKSISDVLALNKEDWLKRRLQTILSKKYNITPKLARQLIVHKHVKVGGVRVNSPSYIVKKGEEEKIEITLKKKISEENNKKLNENIFIEEK